MRKYLIFSILITALVSVACENTIKYEYDLNDGEMTILGQLSTADTTHTIFLSMSYPDRIDSLPGATVECFVNGSRTLARPIPAGYREETDWMTGETSLVPNHFPYTEYEFEAIFKPGDKVRIEATKGQMDVWTEVVIPQPITLIAIDTVTLVKSSVYQSFGETETYEQEYVEFTVRLSDAKGTDSYYSMDPKISTVIKLSSENEEDFSTISRGPSEVSYETFHDLILEDGYSSGMGDMFEDLVPVNYTRCFSDKMFRDSEAAVRLYIPTYYFRSYPYEYYNIASKIVVDKTFHLSVKSFDRDFYNYLRAINNMQCYGYEVSPIIEPTMLPSNITGGMGIVSVASESGMDITFPTEVYHR